MISRFKFIKPHVHQRKQSSEVSVMNFAHWRKARGYQQFFKFIMTNLNDELMNLRIRLYSCGVSDMSQFLTQVPLLRNGGKLRFCPSYVSSVSPRGKSRKTPPVQQDFSGGTFLFHHNQLERSQR